MDNEQLKAVDGETLLCMDLKSPEFIIDKLLPEGLHLLAGSPKVGKSWLVMWLCLQVSIGGDVWGFPTNKSGALLLSLEDNLNRIQHRLSLMTENSSQNLYIATEAAEISNGLEGQIDAFLSEHPETKLIVIDTLQKVRSNNDKYSYSHDYEELSKLKAIAYKNNIAIIAVHHLRKMMDSDPMNMISGTNGMSGAVDSNFVLLKETRNSNKALFHITGRDIEDNTLPLEFDKEEFVWKIVDKEKDKTESKYAPTIEAIVTYINSLSFWSGTATQLIDEMFANDLRLYHKANVLATILNDNISVLENDFGIRCTFKRTSEKRLIILEHIKNESGEN